MDINLASHAHQVPHVGWPHNEPVIIAKQVNIKPNGAILLLIIIRFLVLNIKLIIDNKAIQVKEAKPIHADGT